MGSVIVYGECYLNNAIGHMLRRIQRETRASWLIPFSRAEIRHCRDSGDCVRKFKHVANRGWDKDKGLVFIIDAEDPERSADKRDRILGHLVANYECEQAQTSSACRDVHVYRCPPHLFLLILDKHPEDILERRYKDLWRSLSASRRCLKREEVVEKVKRECGRDRCCEAVRALAQHIIGCLTV